MSTQKVPNSNKQWIQSNNGDYEGNLYETHRCDLDSDPGVLKASKALAPVDIYNNTQFPVAMQIHDGYYYIAFVGTGDDEVWRCSVNSDPTDDSNWLEVTDLKNAAEIIESDMTSFNGLLLLSEDTDIWSWNGTSEDNDWWTAVAGGGALTNDKPHQMEVLRSGNDTLFVTDGNKVRYYNSAAGNTVITLDTFMTAGCLTSSLDRIWVGTYTEVENNGYVYELRVGDDTAYQAYPIEGRVCLAMFTHRNTPFVITETGYIQAFDGAGFTTVAQFPWANESTVMEGCRGGQVQDSPRSKAIHPKGVKLRGNYVYILVNAEDEFTGDLLKRGYSGVWVLDLTTYSLTHRYSLGTSDLRSVGPLLLTNTPYTRIMAGADTVSDGDGVWMETDTTPRGFFVLTRHESDSIADVFDTFVYKVDTLDDDSSVQVKRKDSEQPGFPYVVNGVTWASVNEFNTTDDLTNVAVGDEVFILNKQGSDTSCHITAIKNGAEINTVTVDESIGVLNETSDIKIDKFEKIDMSNINEGGEYFKLGIGNEAKTFAQYKIEFTGDVTFRELISKSNNKEGL